jgi:hypothetical protein
MFFVLLLLAFFIAALGLTTSSVREANTNNLYISITLRLVEVDNNANLTTQIC